MRKLFAYCCIGIPYVRREVVEVVLHLNGQRVQADEEVEDIGR